MWKILLCNVTVTKNFSTLCYGQYIHFERQVSVIFKPLFHENNEWFQNGKFNQTQDECIS